VLSEQQWSPDSQTETKLEAWHVSVDELVYDWNTIEPALSAPNRHIGFDDETLRDGLQSPSVREPLVEQKIELLHLMDALGIDTADIGLPGAGGGISNSDPLTGQAGWYDVRVRIYPAESSEPKKTWPEFMTL